MGEWTPTGETLHYGRCVEVMTLYGVAEEIGRALYNGEYKTLEVKVKLFTEYDTIS